MLARMSPGTPHAGNKLNKGSELTSDSAGFLSTLDSLYRGPKPKPAVERPLPQSGYFCSGSALPIGVIEQQPFAVGG